MEAVFKLSRRKGSAKWQVRTRWPSDVARILPGEFNTLAQFGLPVEGVAIILAIDQFLDLRRTATNERWHCLAGYLWSSFPQLT